MFRRITTFFREAREEFAQVHWPSRKEAIYLTLVVIGLSLALAIFLGALDNGFSYLLQSFIVK